MGVDSELYAAAATLRHQSPHRDVASVIDKPVTAYVTSVPGEDVLQNDRKHNGGYLLDVCYGVSF